MALEQQQSNGVLYVVRAEIFQTAQSCATRKLVDSSRSWCTGTVQEPRRRGRSAFRNRCQKPGHDAQAEKT
jgi:hypothetical protein